MSRKWWFTAAALVTATLYRSRLRAYLEQASANVRAFDLPSAKYRQDIIAICLRHDTSDWNRNKTLDCERSNRTPT
jgi:hypothetical protein